MSSNKLLSRLSRDDAQLFEPYLQAVDLPIRKQLHTAKRRVEHVYFIERGVASIVANGTHPIEVGMIGREGMIGTSVLLGNSGGMPYDIYMQVAGNGQQMPADRLREAIAKSPTLHQVLLRYVRPRLHHPSDANGAGERAWQDRGAPGAMAADGA